MNIKINEQSWIVHTVNLHLFILIPQSKELNTQKTDHKKKYLCKSPN